jgi:CRISPR/Cas system CMR subunit Cmr6 (Cas7 group RAMP superfamily)
MTFDLGSEISRALLPWLQAVSAAPKEDKKGISEDALHSHREIFTHRPGLPLALAELDEGFKPAWEAWFRGWQKQLAAAEPMPPQPTIEIQSLPPYSWFLQFKFDLERPVSTGDEPSLAPTDNMFRVERATGLPLFAASSWKGCFGAALREIVSAEEFEDASRILMGGTPGENEIDEAARGRLTFFSSYFDKLATYVFHPLNRKTKTGTPITVQVVPEKATAFFSLLYTPLAQFFTLPESQLRRQYAEHKTFALQAVHAMFRLTGFGAKTSSGFGTARDSIDGTFSTRSAKCKLTSFCELRKETEEDSGEF